MRINFIVPHLKISGGVKIILSYAHQLGKRGHDVKIFVSHRSGWKRFLMNLFHLGYPGWMPHLKAKVIRVEDLSELNLTEADVCLGIFGTTDKAKRVIPNKIYEAIVMGKPVITADTPAIRELFFDRENILLVNMGDSGDLAKKITELRDGQILRDHIVEGGFKLYREIAVPITIGKNLLKGLNWAYEK